MVLVLLMFLLSLISNQALVPWLHKYHLLVFYLWPRSGP